MGNYRCRQPGYLAAWKITAAELMFQGKQDAEIVKTLWPYLTDDPPGLTEEQKKKKIQNKGRMLNTLRKDPKFQEYFKSIVTEWKVHNVGPALNALSSQVMQTKDLWLQNKAANDILNHGKDIYEEEDKNVITIQFEGAPELGSPADAGDDD